ncbi:hypothetical protein K8I61_02620 [bacterium]|nr:hypothetical protein [bacterium]
MEFLISVWLAIAMLVAALARPVIQLAIRAMAARHETPIDIVSRRYAVGEIDRATYRRMRANLGT